MMKLDVHSAMAPIFPTDKMVFYKKLIADGAPLSLF
jgi:hypothetical protein